MSGFFEAATHYDADPQPLHDLIDSGANLSRADRLGLTLLHYACREGHLNAVVSLVEAGCPLEAQDRDARTPLHLACYMAGRKLSRGTEHLEIATYLQQHDRVGGGEVQDLFQWAGGRYVFNTVEKINYFWSRPLSHPYKLANESRMTSRTKTYLFRPIFGSYG